MVPSIKRKPSALLNENGQKTLKKEVGPISRQLKLKRPSKVALSDYIVKTELYEDNWMEKQEKVLARWINYELSHSNGENFNELDNSMSSFSCNLEKERLRSTAFSLYQSEEFVAVIHKLDQVS